MITDKDRNQARAFRMLVEEALEDRWEKEDPGELSERGKAALERARATLRDATKASAFRHIVE